MLELEEDDPEKVEKDADAALAFAEQVWELLDGQSIILQCTVIQTLILQLMEFHDDREHREHLRDRLMQAIERGLNPPHTSSVP
jgi:hypothetical protein